MTLVFLPPVPPGSKVITLTEEEEEKSSFVIDQWKGKHSNLPLMKLIYEDDKGNRYRVCHFLTLT